MPTITQFFFDLYPKNPSEHGFHKPYTHLFRGVFMQWLQAYDQQLGNRLHEQQPENTPFFIRKYAIQQHRSSPRSDLSDKNEENTSFDYESLPHRRKTNLDHIRFAVNSIDSDISASLLQFLLHQQDQNITLGDQLAVIGQIQIRQNNLDDIFKLSAPIRRIKIQFLTPTAFSLMENDGNMRVPLPQYFFGNLERQWNAEYLKTEMEIPKDLYAWVTQHVFISSYTLKTEAWAMGKEIPFVGCRGECVYMVDLPEPFYCHWLHVLARLGVFMNVGNGRGAGFGRYRIKEFDEMQL